MAAIRLFDIKKLKPFHRDSDTMPNPAPEKADQLSQLDPDLRPDEQSYVSHYLAYADKLLNEPEEETPPCGPKSHRSNVIELPKTQKPMDPDPDDESGNAA